MTESNQSLFNILLDRDCVMLDGKCDCLRRKGKSFPICKKYTSKELKIFDTQLR